jgi:hypothetical protein
MAKSAVINFKATFDSSQINQGIQDIRKRMSSSHIGDELRNQINDALQGVTTNLPTLEKFMGKTEFNDKELKNYQSVVQNIIEKIVTLNGLVEKADFGSAFSSIDLSKMKTFDKQIESAEEKIKNAQKAMVTGFSETTIGTSNNKAFNNLVEGLIGVPENELPAKLKEISNEVNQEAGKFIDNLKTLVETKVSHKTGKANLFEKIFGTAEGVELKPGKTVNPSQKDSVGAYAIYNSLRDRALQLQDGDTEGYAKVIEDFNKFVEEYFKVPEGVQPLFSGIIGPEIADKFTQAVESMSAEDITAALGVENLKVVSEGEAEKAEALAQKTALLDEREKANILTKEQLLEIIKKLGVGLGNTSDEIEKNKEQLAAEAKKAEALADTFDSLAHRITSSVSALTVFDKMKDIVRDAVASVKELDAAFTQIAIVSGQTNEQAWEMFESFNNLARQYSVTTKDLTEGAKLFYQQGLNAADTMKMVEASTVSAALGEVTMAEAANTLTSAIQGYNESADMAMSYTDKIAMVGAASAADFNELSASMEKTASSAYTAGIDFDHLLG